MDDDRSFILTPINKILEKAVLISDGLGGGIASFHTIDYIIHSVFLKMSGALEQKAYSIAWELASSNYTNRYAVLQGKYRGASTLSDKSKIFHLLADEVLKRPGTNEYCIPYNKYCDEVKAEIEKIFKYTIFYHSMARSYKEFGDIMLDIKDQIRDKPACCNYNESKQLFNDTGFGKIYENYIIKTRNQLAHNELANRLNLPCISDLASDEIKRKNYFLYFGVFLLIDKIFIDLFKEYQSA